MYLGEWVKAQYHKLMEPNFVFVGCTDEEIEQVKTFQNIAYIPEAYRDLMRVMGHGGLSRIAAGEANWNLLEKVKKDFMKMLKYHKIVYPDDLLVFYEEEDTFYFCRTQPEIDDPAVYGYSGAWRGKTPPYLGLAKLATSLSAFWEMLILESKSRVEKTHEYWEPIAKVYYDAELDEFIEERRSNS